MTSDVLGSPGDELAVRPVRAFRSGVFWVLGPTLMRMVASVARLHGDGRVIAAGVSGVALVVIPVLGLWMGRRSTKRAGFELSGGQLTYTAFSRPKPLFVDHRPGKVVEVTVAPSRSGRIAQRRFWLLLDDRGVREAMVDPTVYDPQQLEALRNRLGIPRAVVQQPLSIGEINSRYPELADYSQAIVSSADPEPID